jgi:hypothetical protein
MMSLGKGIFQLNNNNNVVLHYRCGLSGFSQKLSAVHESMIVM